ncbi:NTP transferase domain-containing protein [Haloarchaeobius sp. TZWWS8]|uniref:NTP transferase domain-containing protein n=1 Tax=Haloarchaeobius sp. TZWWS8 TaxID=3446121 RepID=UPI003EC0033C
MCGGRGTRLETDGEKPLFRVGGRPMVDRVVDALVESRVEAVFAAVSPHAPATRDHLRSRPETNLVETPGEGYVADLQHALATVEPPVLTVAADLPLLAPACVNQILDHYDGLLDNDGLPAQHDGQNLAIVVPTALKRVLGASCDTELDGSAPTGVNVVADSDSETMYTSYDVRLAVNVNRPADARLAEALCD